MHICVVLALSSATAFIVWHSQIFITELQNYIFITKLHLVPEMCLVCYNDLTFTDTMASLKTKTLVPV